MDEDLVEPSAPSESSPLQNEVETNCGKVEYSAQERAVLELRQRKQRVRRRPHIAYVSLSGAQLFLGVVILAVGGAAFGTTPSYRAGCFWAGLVVSLCTGQSTLYQLSTHCLHTQLLGEGVYNFILLFLKFKFYEKRWLKRSKRILVIAKPLIHTPCSLTHPLPFFPSLPSHIFQSHIVVALCILSILVAITAAALDILAAYMLHRTDFSRCLHTNTHIIVDCDSETCSDLRLSPNTCYCCYLYKGHKSKDCSSPFLLDKTPYFEGVASCSVLRDVLCPMVLVVALLEVLSTVLNIIFLFKNRPIHYYKGKTSEQEQGEGEGEGEEESIVSRFTPKWFKTVKKRRDVKYTATNTEDNSSS